MDERVERHRKLAKFHTEIADQIEKLLQPDARGEEPARPAAAVEATKGGKEGQRKLHLVKRPRFEALDTSQGEGGAEGCPSPHEQQARCGLKPCPAPTCKQPSLGRRLSPQNP